MPIDGEGEGMLTGEEEVTDNGPVGVPAARRDGDGQGEVHRVA